MITKEMALRYAQNKDPDATLFIVRLWDGFDGEWMDVSEPLTADQAMAEWDRRTEGGSRKTNFDDIDYYAIYPSTIRMRFADGQSLFG